MIFDSYALIAFFDDEPSAAEVEKLLADARQNGTKTSISVINAGEIWYNYARKFSEDFADEMIAKTREIKIEFIPVNWHVVQIAAQFKSRGGISYANCFAAALANTRNTPLVTGDPEFEQLKDEIEIIWV